MASYMMFPRGFLGVPVNACHIHDQSAIMRKGSVHDIKMNNSSTGKGPSGVSVKDTHGRSSKMSY